MQSVNLISYTVPSPELVKDSITSPQDLIAYCARVSNPENQNNVATADKLIAYLIKNKHWSPLEMVDVTLEINTTRDIARQILRHRSFSFQEFSQRYADASQLGFEIREARLQDKKNRQNSLETEDDTLKNEWDAAQKLAWNAAIQAYKGALEKGIAKEVARSVLPEGMTLSRIYMKGSLRSWVHYLELRCGNGTQKEHQEIAEKCKEIILSLFPALKDVLNG